MKTYYIAEGVDSYDGQPEFRAYHSGVLSALNIFNDINVVICTSGKTADRCEERLKIKLHAEKVKPVVVRVVKI